MVKSEDVLYIEPSRHISSMPVIDSLTRKMTAAFRQAKEGISWRGYHRCACGVSSSSCDYILPNGEETNSLCIHYLAYHRGEVPQFQLDKVAALDCGEAEPTKEELKGPEFRRF